VVELMLILWAGILVPAIAFLLNLQINYSLVPWVCVTGKAFALHAATAGTIALAGSGGLASWTAWRRETEGRSRFMAIWGLMMSALFFVVIVAQAIPIFMLDPCHK
jgi:hypothetical protein